MTFRLALLLTVLVLGAGELGGRVIVPRGWSRPMYRTLDSAPGYALRADYASDERRVGVTIDASGRRVAATRVTNGSARVVDVIGGSDVFGVDVDDAATIPARLQTLLGPAYRVVNGGVPGYGPYAYVDEALAQRASVISIIVLSESDDLRAAYSASARASVHCHYLIPLDSPAQKLPCFALASGIVRGVGYLRARVARADAVVPLAYDPGSTFAAHVLAARVRRLVAACKRRAAAHLIVTFVPWAGALEGDRNASRPPAEARNVLPSVDFTDEAGVSRALREAKGERYEPDGSLSVLGAGIVARALASEVRRRTRLRETRY